MALVILAAAASAIAIAGLIVGDSTVAARALIATVPPLAACVALLPGAPPHWSGRGRTLVDGLIMAGSLLLIAWVAGLGDLYGEGASDATTLHLIAAVGQTAVAGAAIVILTRARVGVRGVLALAAAGLAMIAAATAASVYLALGSGVPEAALYAGWAIGLALLALGARRASRMAPLGEAHPGLPGQASVFIPSVPFAAAVLALATAVAGDTVDDALIWQAAVLTLLVIARQVLALAENIGFWRRQEDEVAARAAELERGEARFRYLLQNSSDVIVVIGNDGFVQYESPAMERSFGYELGALAVGSPLNAVHPDDRDEVRAAALELLHMPGATQSAEFRVRGPGDSWRMVEAVATNVRDDPTVGGFIVNARDVTERVERDQFSHRAMHDPLTNLANRTLFGDRIRHAVSRSTRTDESVALLFVDLDDFKRVNDGIGHAAGDKLLIAVAEALRECIRDADTAARLGGDEFAVLIEQLDSPEEAEEVAERILAYLLDPIDLGGVTASAPCSIGIAITRGDQTSAEALLRRADAAMYTAKAQGKARVALYDSVPSGDAGHSPAAPG